MTSFGDHSKEWTLRPEDRLLVAFCVSGIEQHGFAVIGNGLDILPSVLRMHRNACAPGQPMLHSSPSNPHRKELRSTPERSAPKLYSPASAPPSIEPADSGRGVSGQSPGQRCGRSSRVHPGHAGEPCCLHPTTPEEADPPTCRFQGAPGPWRLQPERIHGIVQECN